MESYYIYTISFNENVDEIIDILYKRTFWWRKHRRVNVRSSQKEDSKIDRMAAIVFQCIFHRLFLY